MSPGHCHVHLPTKLTVDRHVKTLVGVIDFSFHVKDRDSDDSSIDSAEDKKAGDV